MHRDGSVLFACMSRDEMLGGGRERSAEVEGEGIAGEDVVQS